MMGGYEKVSESSQVHSNPLNDDAAAYKMPIDLFSVLNDITINLSSNLEPINKGQFGVNRCIEVPAYSSGFIKIPIAALRTPPDIRLSAELQPKQLYPNPVHDYLTVAQVGIKKYSIINSNGLLLMENTLSNDFQINVANLPAGIYQLILENTNGELMFQSFVKL